MLSIFLKTVMKRRRKFWKQTSKSAIIDAADASEKRKNESPDKAGHTVAGAGQHGSCGGQYHWFYHYVTDWRHRKFHIYADTRRIYTYIYFVEGHEYWRLLTCMFLHFGVRHLFNNMLVLAFVGDRLEKSAGKVRYMIIYFGGGLLSSLASVGFEYWSGDFYVSAGASGAIFAVVGAVAWIVIRDRGQFQEISMFQIIMFILFSIYLGFQNGGVDNAAHVGGLISGFALGFLICRRKIYRRRQARG